MQITDGAEYIKQVKDFETLKGEIYARFIVRRKVVPLTGEIKPEFAEEFDEAVRQKVETYFGYILRKYQEYVRELDIDDTTIRERSRTFTSQAERIKHSQYAVKTEGRITA